MPEASWLYIIILKFIEMDKFEESHLNLKDNFS